MSDLERDAPAFDPERNNYPLGGAKTGPAWRAAWWFLRDMGEHSAVDIIAHVQSEHPELHTETIRNVLYGAVRAGILESELRLDRGRNRTHFRIKR